MLSLTSPVATAWHPIPAGTKMAALCLATLVLFAGPAPWAQATMLAVVATMYLLGGRVFFLHGLRMLRPLVPFVVVVTLWHLWSGDPAHAVLLALRLLAAVSAANLVTMTTRLSDMVAVIERLCAPLARLGVNPRVIGLAVALVIRFIPVMAERVARLTEAWRARSARRAGWRVALPATLGALDDAEHVADALRARGGAG